VYVLKDNGALLHFITNEEMAHINMLCSIVAHNL